MIFIPFFFAQINSDENKPAREKKRILIIEDNIETQLIFKIYLRSLYSVDTADTGERGVDLIKENKYDMLLLDINLPGKLNGEDVLEIIRNELNMNDFPVIVITAYALKGDKERFLRKGANNYLSKPVEKSVLLNEVGKFLK